MIPPLPPSEHGRSELTSHQNSPAARPSALRPRESLGVQSRVLPGTSQLLPAGRRRPNQGEKSERWLRARQPSVTIPVTLEGQPVPCPSHRVAAGPRSTSREVRMRPPGRRWAEHPSLSLLQPVQGERLRELGWKPNPAGPLGLGPRQGSSCRPARAGEGCQARADTWRGGRAGAQRTRACSSLLHREQGQVRAQPLLGG